MAAPEGDDYCPRSLARGPPLNGPVFVVGASRSGTALLRSSLNLHPRLHVAGETHWFDDGRLRVDGPLDRPASPTTREMLVAYFGALSHRPYGHAGVPERGWLEPAALQSLAEELGGRPDDYFAAYCRLEAIHDTGASVPRWGEKTPRHVYRIQEIAATFPGARIICMVRDPRAVVASYRDWENQGGFDLDADTGYADALAEERDRTRASYHPAIATMLWRATVRQAARARHELGDDVVRAVRYEDLVTSPDATMTAVCGWLGERFDPAMRDVPLHNSSFSRFDLHGGFQQGAVERWRDRLDEDEVAVVQQVAGSTLRACGYEPLPVDRARRRALPHLAGAPVAVVRAGVANLRRIQDPVDYVVRRARAVL